MNEFQIHRVFNFLLITLFVTGLAALVFGISGCQSFRPGSVATGDGLDSNMLAESRRADKVDITGGGTTSRMPQALDLAGGTELMMYPCYASDVIGWHVSAVVDTLPPSGNRVSQTDHPAAGQCFQYVSHRDVGGISGNMTLADGHLTGVTFDASNLQSTSGVHESASAYQALVSGLSANGLSLSQSEVDAQLQQSLEKLNLRELSISNLSQVLSDILGRIGGR